MALSIKLTNSFAANALSSFFTVRVRAWTSGRPHLDVNESIDAVFASEARQKMILVLIYPSLEIIGYADVQSAMEVRENIDPVFAHQFTHG